MFFLNDWENVHYELRIERVKGKKNEKCFEADGNKSCSVYMGLHCFAHISRAGFCCRSLWYSPPFLFFPCRPEYVSPMDDLAFDMYQVCVFLVLFMWLSHMFPSRFLLCFLDLLALMHNIATYFYFFGVIVWVRVVFRKTVGGDWGFDYRSSSHLGSQVVETPVTNNSLSKDYPHPDDHAKEITDTPGFKPFTIATYIECGLVIQTKMSLLTSV